MKDPYTILEVSKEASLDEIKKAYYRKAKELHPDRNKSAQAEEEMKELNSAYGLLSNPENRRRYDDGFNTENWNRPPPQYGNAGGYQYDYTNNWDDIFEEMRKRGSDESAQTPQFKTYNILPVIIIALVLLTVFGGVALKLAVSLFAMMIGTPLLMPVLIGILLYYLIIKRSVSGFIGFLTKTLFWIVFLFFIMTLVSAAGPVLFVIFIILLLWNMV